MNIDLALKTILYDYNLNIFSDQSRIISYLYDLMPDGKKDIRRIRMAYDSGAIKQLEKHASNPDIAFQKACFSLREVDVEQGVAIEVVSTIIKALGWEFEDRDENYYQRATTLYENHQYGEAVKFYKLAIQEGHIEAINSLGRCCHYGNGVRQNNKKAISLYKKAVTFECTDAITNLGECYVYGWCGVNDVEKGKRLIIKAANRGYARAQRTLGVLYTEGIGFPVDNAQAFKWFLIAAKQGDEVAEHNLGVCYSKGRGTPQDFNKALELYQNAATKGVKESWGALGALHEKIGNLHEASKCYKKAIELGIDAKAPYKRVTDQIRK